MLYFSFYTSQMNSVGINLIANKNVYIMFKILNNTLQ